MVRLHVNWLLKDGRLLLLGVWAEHWLLLLHGRLHELLIVGGVHTRRRLPHHLLMIMELLLYALPHHLMCCLLLKVLLEGLHLVWCHELLLLMLLLELVASGVEI